MNRGRLGAAAQPRQGAFAETVGLINSAPREISQLLMS